MEIVGKIALSGLVVFTVVGAMAFIFDQGHLSKTEGRLHNKLCVSLFAICLLGVPASTIALALSFIW